MRKRTKLLLALAGTLATVVVAAFLVYWFVIRSDPPAKVSLDGALGSITPQATTAATPGAGATTTGGNGAPAAGLDGTWVPDTAQQSFAGYRVVEELARI